LDVNRVEAEAVFLDQPIDPFIASPPDDHAGILLRAAVAHGFEKVDNELFERSGWH
jgi:hypothetical protein